MFYEIAVLDLTYALYDLSERVKPLRVIVITLIVSIFADGFSGKYKVICGGLVMGFGVGATFIWSMFVQRLTIQISYFAMKISNWFIARGVVIAFLGDQFNLPEEKDKMWFFLSLPFVLTKLSLLCGEIIFGSLTMRFGCLGYHTCYPIIFSLIIFLGKGLTLC